MFSRSQNKSFSKSQKPSKSSSSFSKESGISKHRRHQEQPRRRPTTSSSASTYAAYADQTPSPRPNQNLTSAIVTLVVGRDQRLFAAHADILCASPFFQRILQNLYYDPVATPPSAALASPTPSAVSTSSASSRRITLPDDEPEIFSCVLEYLYKGDYYPRLLHNKHRNSWELEQSMDNGDGNGHGPEASIFQHPVDGDLLKDTVIYCSAEKFGLDELKRIALRKQGLQSGIQCATILSSARYAYANTPETDSKLRAHYLALIIRSRNTFKRSGTMQLEMYNGGTQLFFDLFVALCNHVDDISSTQASPHSNRLF